MTNFLKLIEKIPCSCSIICWFIVDIDATVGLWIGEVCSVQSSEEYEENELHFCQSLWRWCAVFERNVSTSTRRHRLKRNVDADLFLFIR
ncbi:hypothetical protein GWI33_006357 [Rhynchophorus ferrugineus]|uniref:Uncharacterized protein n=1 Tax=Rhynchophorus ferrugineus TaxID=354439 RepID=A0A834MJJ9_RHYFE|nr:hypothetical protein GWI33_006357 [Rhynchophorus ferrugineus]